ncbi:MAG TPA: ATP-grasp domain-containing protein [Nitrosopumilaceae archaeon]|jgi:carbamoyl-phosphate synthase large subunit|nr:ATP-grasp domain-containing protein [Nitrosopumilaceae archaeon]
MVKYATVMVTGAGSILGQGIIKCLHLNNKKKNTNVFYKIVGVDMSIEAIGLYRSDLGLVVPSASSDNYINSIIKICKDKKIEAIFVGTDQELLPLANAKKLIETESGAVVISNPPEVISICRDKWNTFEFLKNNNLDCAESSLIENKENFIKEYNFPIVVKPREGYGSLHFYVVKNYDELGKAISEIQKVGWRPILQEYLDAIDSEFTTGVTMDKDGEKIMSSISLKRILKNGQTNKAFVDDYNLVRESAKDAAIKLGCTGAINVQAIQANEEVKIFEINPRFSASVPIRATAGVNEPDIIFRNNILDEEIMVNDYQKLVCMRYLDEMYVPLSTFNKSIDDTRVENSDSFTESYF